jgi:hypothetical protein
MTSGLLAAESERHRLLSQAAEDHAGLIIGEVSEHRRRMETVMRRYDDARSLIEATYRDRLAALKETP